MAKTNTPRPKTAARKPKPENSSAPAQPVTNAEVSAKEALQGASGAATLQNPATSSNDKEDLPPAGTGTDAVHDDEALPDLPIEAVIVTSEVEGFRRAGRAWSKVPTTVPIDELSDEEIAALEAEPLLSVAYFVGAEVQG